MIAAAGTGEAELDELQTGLLEMCFGGQRKIMIALAQGHSLRPGLTAEQAADTFSALTRPELHHRLTVKRGWSQRRYARSLEHTTTAALLGDQRSRPASYIASAPSSHTPPESPARPPAPSRWPASRSSRWSRRAGLPGAQDRTGGEIRGRPWGELAAARGDFRWPPTGRISWPRTQGEGPLTWAPSFH